MGKEIIALLNNDELTKEEKTALLKNIAQELLEQEKKENDAFLVEENKEEFEKMTDKQKENYLNSRRRFVSMTEEERQNDAIKKANQNTDEYKNRLEEINKQGLVQDYNNGIIEQMEILSFLKNKMGENQYSKTYLQSLSGYELEAIYKDCLELMPEAMANAKAERDNAKANGVVIFEKYGFENDSNKEESNQNQDENTNVQDASENDVMPISNNQPIPNENIDLNASSSQIPNTEPASNVVQTEEPVTQDNSQKTSAGLEDISKTISNFSHETDNRKTDNDVIDVKDFSDLEGLGENSKVDEQVSYNPNSAPSVKTDDTLVMNSSEINNTPQNTVVDLGNVSNPTQNQTVDNSLKNDGINSETNTGEPVNFEYSVTSAEPRKKVKKIANLASKMKDFLARSAQKALDNIKRLMNAIRGPKKVNPNDYSSEGLSNDFNSLNLSDSALMGSVPGAPTKIA